MLLTGNDINEIILIKAFLHQQFTIRDLGKAKYFLGIEIMQNQQEIYVNQRKYMLI